MDKFSYYYKIVNFKFKYSRYIRIRKFNCHKPLIPIGLKFFITPSYIIGNIDQNQWLNLPLHIWNIIFRKLDVEVFRLRQICTKLKENVEKNTIGWDMETFKRFYSFIISTNYLLILTNLLKHQKVDFYHIKSHKRKRGGSSSKSCPKVYKNGAIQLTTIYSQISGYCTFILGFPFYKTVFIWVICLYYKLFIQKNFVRVNKPIVNGKLFQEFEWRVGINALKVRKKFL